VINVIANPVGTDIEVELKLEGKAEAAGTVMFSFDLSFAGIFRILNVPQESMHPLVMIECPRLLFPFAREIIAAVVRNGGFPQFLIEPVDFVALYRQRAEQAQTQPPAPAA
jgi:preprotein translocase subunit SecB